MKRQHFEALCLAIIILCAAYLPNKSGNKIAAACYTESGFVGPMPVADTIIEHIMFTDDEAQEILSTIVEENWYQKYDSLGVFTFESSDTIWYCVWNPRTMTVDTRQCYCNEEDFKIAKGLMKKPTTKHLPSRTSKVTAEGFGGKKVYYGSEAIKRAKRQKYIARFAEVAQKEMEKYGIPASITLAQGILESNAGESPLAVNNNNHFGIKCFSKSCWKGHCSNYTDDSHKDFFRKYKTAWESYRGHSHLLRADRYKPLYKLPPDDYKRWAHGLKKAGYATDKYYAEKLINLIEEYRLYQYDK